MITLIAIVLVYFFALPILSGAFIAITGRATLNAESEKASNGFHPLDPFYESSHYGFGK